jgi:hypothetical protein
MVSFCKHQRKDDVTQQVLLVGDNDQVRSTTTILSG